jgi:hypothetical protein
MVETRRSRLRLRATDSARAKSPDVYLSLTGTQNPRTPRRVVLGRKTASHFINVGHVGRVKAGASIAIGMIESIVPTDSTLKTLSARVRRNLRDLHTACTHARRKIKVVHYRHVSFVHAR